MSQKGQSLPKWMTLATSAFPLIETELRTLRDVSNVQILLQKSKIERRRKSRESRFLDATGAATPCSSDTEVRGRFCVNQCGPSRPHAQNASAVRKNCRRQPKMTFATLSARNRHPTSCLDSI